MNDWIEWNGGEMPVHPQVLVDIKQRDGFIFESYPAGLFGGEGDWWRHEGDTDKDDIVAYRIWDRQMTGSETAG